MAPVTVAVYRAGIIGHCDPHLWSRIQNMRKMLCLRAADQRDAGIALTDKAEAVLSD